MWRHWCHRQQWTYIFSGQCATLFFQWIAACIEMYITSCICVNTHYEYWSLAYVVIHCHHCTFMLMLSFMVTSVSLSLYVYIILSCVCWFVWYVIPATLTVYVLWYFIQWSLCLSQHLKITCWSCGICRKLFQQRSKTDVAQSACVIENLYDSDLS